MDPLLYTASYWLELIVFALHNHNTKNNNSCLKPKQRQQPVRGKVGWEEEQLDP